MILAPVTLAVLWWGGFLFAALAALAAALMALEWGYLTGVSDRAVRAWVLALLGSIAVLMSALAGILAGMVTLIVLIAILERQRSMMPDNVRPLWFWTGLIWITLPCIGLVWLRGQSGGAQTVLWLVLTVWVIDTAAFATGRAIGGPRLAPRISPSKTWSGLIGGVVASALVAAIAGIFKQSPHLLALTGIGMLLGVVEQGGDLAESYAKRYFGVKDSGNLIPGHGGLLDRLDGMLAVIIAVVLINLGFGESILTWR